MQMEPFINYGTVEEPLYLTSNIAKISGIPRRTICDQIFRLSTQDIVVKTINVETIRRALFYTQVKKCKLLKLTGLRKVLCAVRHNIKQDILDYYSITELNRFQCEEAKYLDPIIEAFQGEEIITQYQVGSYRLDAYFPRYNIVVEVDEPGHRYYKIKHQLERTVSINFMLKNPTIIRINLLENVSIFKIINKVYKAIAA